MGQLNGVASAIDLFNQDVYFSPGGGGLPAGYELAPDAAFVFVDNLFDPSLRAFSDYSNGPISLDATSGSGVITTDELINAVTNIAVHEFGHLLGLLHLPPESAFVTHAGSSTRNRLRTREVFSVESRGLDPDEKLPGSEQNDRRRLAFAVGSDVSPADLPRQSPPPAAVNRSNLNSFSLAATAPAGVHVRRAVLGVVPPGGEDTLPQLIDLGEGDLAELLRRPLLLAPGARVFLVASTNGTGIDIFGLPAGSSTLPGDVTFPSILSVLLDERIRADLFNADGSPGGTALRIFRRDGTGTRPIGAVGLTLAPTPGGVTLPRSFAVGGDRGAGPIVRSHNPDGTERFSFVPFDDFRGGVRVAEAALRNGAFVAAGDVDGDGFAEVIAGGGPGGGPRASVFTGADLVRSGTVTRQADFFVGDVSKRGGVRIAVKDLDGDGRADVLTGAGPGAGSRVIGYAGVTLAGDRPPELLALDAIPGFTEGVFVG